MSPLKAWLNLFAVSENATVSAAIVSFVTPLLILMPLTRKCFGSIHLWTSCFFRRGENKQAAETIHSFPSLKLSKQEIVWKLHTTFFNRARGDSKKIRCHKSVLCTKRENWCYLKYNCYRPLRRECGITRMNLNSRTDCIILARLELMRLACCVLPQGKALNVRL